MAKNTKQRKEKFIRNRVSSRTGITTFQVAFVYKDFEEKSVEYTKSFCESDYCNKTEALNQACCSVMLCDIN